MKTYKGEYYRAEDYRGQFGFGGTYDDQSIESLREAITYSNRRAIEQGYATEKYIIVKHEFVRTVDDNGGLIHSAEIVTAVEHFPA